MIELLHRILFRGSLIASRKVPFSWFNVPENLRIETQPNSISINQEFTEPTKSQKITKYVGNIVLIAIIVKLVNDVIQYEKSETANQLLPEAAILQLLPATIFLVILIMLNIRRRMKLLIFDFNNNQVKLQPKTFSFIGTKSAKLTSPFSITLEPNTRETQKSYGDEYSHSVVTTYHKGYEVMVNFEKSGKQSVMFLETENLKQDYGDLISKLTSVAGIEDPLMETVGDFWSQS